MLSLFIDEKYENLPGEAKRIVICCWGVLQRKLNARLDLLTSLQTKGRTRIADRISEALLSIDGYALLAWGDLTASQYAAGMSARTSDIPAMARPDAAWSMAVIYAVATLMKKLLQASWAYRTVDVYYDPKGLTSPHAKAWQATLRGLLTDEAVRYCRARGINLGDQIRIRRIEPVRKPNRGQAMDKLQLGTWLAHRICRLRSRLISRGGSGRITLDDMSNLLVATVEQWDGKPFTR
jgi:hypothetical protein